MKQLRLDLSFFHSRVFLLLNTISILLTLSCSRPPAEKKVETERATQQQPANGQKAAPAFSQTEDGQWTMPAKDYASTRYSGLDQINTENVKDLKVAWTFSTGVNRGHEAAPIVVGDTMYVVTPYPNILYALDLTKQKQGSVKWSFDSKAAAAAQGVDSSDTV